MWQLPVFYSFLRVKLTGMEPLKIGIVGLGNMGASHARNIGKLQEARVTAVADEREEVARRIGEEVGAQAFADWRELLNADIEAVLVATPHPSHPEIVAAAAERGLHVLCEKPLAESVSRADAMVGACREAKVLLGVMFQQRVDPSRALLARMVHEGALGELHRVTMSAPWYRPQAYYDSGSWRGTWNGEGGGILMNQAPHSLDLFSWVGGTPQTVQAVATTRGHSIEVENTALAVCDYGAGKVGSFYASTSDVPATELVEVAGERGVLRWENGRVSFYELETPLSEHLQTATGAFDAPRGAWRELEVTGTNEEHNGIIKAFARAVRQNNASLLIATGEDGVRALELANAFLLSGYTRREVSLPLDRAAYDAMLVQLRAGVKPGAMRS